MWVYGDAWLDAEGPLTIRRGQRLDRIGLRALCWTAEAVAGRAHGVSDQVRPRPGDQFLQNWSVTGTVEWIPTAGPDADYTILDVNGVHLFAEADSIWALEPVSRPGAGNGRMAWYPHPVNLAFPAKGVTVTVTCCLGVCPEYVLEDLPPDAPEPHSDWLVNAIEIEVREQQRYSDAGPTSLTHGALIGVEPADQAPAQLPHDLDRHALGHRLDLRRVQK
jgi:hypothetical protein